MKKDIFRLENRTSFIFFPVEEDTTMHVWSKNHWSGVMYLQVI